MVTLPEQVRAARALLRLDQDGLARRATVSVATVRRRRVPSADPTLFRDLEAISIESAGQLTGHILLTDDDLYGEDGLPA